jgi:hypothetical protein
VVHQPVPGLRTLDSRTAPVHMLYGAVTVVCVVKEWGNIKNFHFEGNTKDNNHINNSAIINNNDINNNNFNSFINNNNINNNNINNNNNNNNNNDHNHIFDDDSNSNLKIKQIENILINGYDENCIVVRVIAVQYNNSSADIESRKRSRESLPLFSTSNTTSAYVTIWVVDDSLTNTMNHDTTNIDNTNCSTTDNTVYDGKEICSKKFKKMKKIIFDVPSDFFQFLNTSSSTFSSSSSLPPFECENSGNLSLSLLPLSSVRPGHLILISGIISNTTTTITTITQKIKIPKSVVQFLSKNNCDCNMKMKNEYLKDYFITENCMNDYEEELVEFSDCIPTIQCQLLHDNDTIDASNINNDNNNNNNNHNTSLNSNSISVENEESVLGHLTNISLLSAFHCSPSLFV